MDYASASTVGGIPLVAFLWVQWRIISTVLVSHHTKSTVRVDYIMNRLAFNKKKEKKKINAK